jgi:hypothetical protein
VLPPACVIKQVLVFYCAYVCICMLKAEGVWLSQHKRSNVCSVCSCATLRVAP